ncbi:Peptidoglycan-binding (PGRP) domain of peptidoglycan hydrolases-containing protein [Streptomyces sp. cf124]|uniref:helix-turn-helix domain-containing protein n=1 Tax=Streptomyces sp. cf124 TaxID=1761903 RepID=UPI0008E64739|nr:helix-turn-helix domain-containing protein [Streptomyces sp. cf124]SFM51545.1 Peptidoglycan-binding (PGRP) domain of peptidoglycan hydrolases-containing protein [Streptomyces sp. cf124]
MTATVDPERFAAFLRSLKERSGLSYEALAQRTGSSRSSLHRYCSGSYVPPDYGPVHRFALICGASPTELRELHRLWAVADMSRMADEGAGGGKAAVEPTASPDGTDPVPMAVAVTAAATEPAPAGATGSAPAQVTEAETASVSASTATSTSTSTSTSTETVPSAAGTAAVTVPAGNPWRRRALPLLGLCFLLLVAGGTWATLATRQQAEGADDGRLLFSAACAEPVGMGQHDTCVKEVQRLLAKAGADISVDSSFGPQTLRRVTAFQVLHGLDPDGVVGNETKRALYEPKERIRSWSPSKVRQRVRQVFAEDPDHAVAIADCQSFLDPLHILPNTNGTRNWGVFQISDTRLRELGGTPRKALEPEWNIQAAHRLWKRAGNFDDWPYCERAYKKSKSS